MFEQVGNLRGSDAAKRERWKIIFGEKLRVGRFVTILRSAAGKFAKKESFVGVKGVRGMLVEITVVESGKLGDANFVAGLFPNFPRRRERRRLAHIRPAARQRPAAVLEFSHEKDLVVAEGSNADVDFRSGISGLLGEQFFQGITAGECGARVHHLGGNGADFVVTLNIEFILAIGETGLRDGLQTARPSQPGRNRHGCILAAREAANKSGR